MPREGATVTGVRSVVLVAFAIGCGSSTPAPSPTRPGPSPSPGPTIASPSAGSRSSAGSPTGATSSTAPAPDAAATAPVDPSLPAHDRYPDLKTALRAVIPADARVLGFGELHARVDRASANIPSALSRFTAALPAIADKLSDLVIETWVVDPTCGKKAVVATKKIETEVKRPVVTKSEITVLAEAARAAGIQPHAMTLACKDYDVLAPKNGAPDPVAMLTLTTKELTRIATSAVAFRDRRAARSESGTLRRPWIAVYGGALHNDRFPDKSVAEWSYAAAVDRATRDHFVELDLIVPEFAEADATSRRQPWFPLVANAHQVRVWKRGERSFVVILPRTPSK